jgi:hypothetical protein
MRKLLVIPALILALSLGVAPRAWAIAPTKAIGTYTLLSTTSKLIRTADGNMTLAVVDKVQYKGQITGLPTDTYTLTVRPDGMATAQGVETCTCTIGGRTGDYVSVFSAQGTLANFLGHFAFTSASGGLTGLKGQGIFFGSAASGTIIVNYHFEP